MRGLDTLTQGTRTVLAEDLVRYGGRAVGLSRSAVRELLGADGVGCPRADRLHAWLAAYGTADPVRVRGPTARPTRRQDPPADDPTHVIFGDAHAAPGQDLRRFRDMGEIVRAEAARARAEGRALVVVQIGDWYALDTLCEQETLARRTEGRVRGDIAAGETALEALHVGLGSAAVPEGVSMYLTLGNHDVRVARLADEAPWLEGLYSVGAAHEARGWTVVPFLDPLRLDGWRYQHYLPSRGGRRAIGGVNAARTLLTRVRHQESVVVGHSHLLQVATEAAHTGVRRHGLVVGCWLDHREEYAGEDNAEWWSGYVVLRGVRDGDAECIEFHRRSPEKSRG